MLVRTTAQHRGDSDPQSQRKGLMPSARALDQFLRGRAPGLRLPVAEPHGLLGPVSLSAAAAGDGGAGSCGIRGSPVPHPVGGSRPAKTCSKAAAGYLPCTSATANVASYRVASYRKELASDQGALISHVVVCRFCATTTARTSTSSNDRRLTMDASQYPAMPYRRPWAWRNEVSGAVGAVALSPWAGPRAAGGWPGGGGTQRQQRDQGGRHDYRHRTQFAGDPGGYQGPCREHRAARQHRGDLVEARCLRCRGDQVDT